MSGSKKARHGVEQKFILFDENHPEKYESTNFFYELFLFGHPDNILNYSLQINEKAWYVLIIYFLFL